MTEYKLVPFEPTPEMVEAAEEAHMPFGDMDLALRMAILAAPAVQEQSLEAIASQLLAKRAEILGRPLKWSEAIEITAIVTSMPDEEKQRLLDMDDAPAVQGEPGVKWAPEEVANGNKGIRWVSDEGVHGRPTDHDCRVYLESNPNARGCHCPECTMLYAAPQPGIPKTLT